MVNLIAVFQQPRLKDSTNYPEDKDGISYPPFLLSQNGAFRLSRAASSGSGQKLLTPLTMLWNGYAVQQLYIEAKAATIYITPLNYL